MNVHVKGGTNAGRKRPPTPPAGPWRCACVVEIGYLRPHEIVTKTNPGYLVRCPDCRTARP